MAVAQPDPGEQFLHVFIGRAAGHLDKIRLLDAEAGMEQAVAEVAIVGQEEQALACLIEPADGVNPQAGLRHQIRGEGPACRVVVRAQVAARLVDEPVNKSLGMDRLAVDGDTLLVRIDARAQFADHLAVDRHATGANQLVTVTPRADAGMGQEFVEALHNVIVPGQTS